jgi:hypothetical protein
MKLTQEIIEELTNAERSLEFSLLKTKILAARVSNKAIQDWVNNELNGYPPISSIPEYRNISQHIIGSMANGFYHYKNVPVPIGHLPEDMQAKINTVSMRESVSSLEQLSNATTGRISRPVALEFLTLLNHGIDSDYQTVTAEFIITPASLKQIITSVRSKLLDMILEVDKEFSSEGDLISQSGRDKVEQIFNVTITGSNNTVQAGHNNKQRVNTAVSKNDFGSLRAFLQEYDVSNEDIIDLSEAINNDSFSNQKDGFGPKVKGWIKKMCGKAVDGIWKVSLEVAPKLITEGLNKYYGLH